MISVEKFDYVPYEDESEKASNSYLMSLLAIMVGLPLPIVNLMATFIFYLGNRKSTYFVRWHATQALLSQFSLLLMNTAAFWWTIDIFMQESEITTPYISYMMTIFIFNLAEFIATIFTAIQTRKGVHVRWWFYSDITDVAETVEFIPPDKPQSQWNKTHNMAWLKARGLDCSGSAAEVSQCVNECMNDPNGEPPLMKHMMVDEHDAAHITRAMYAMIARVMVTTVTVGSADDLDRSIKVRKHWFCSAFGCLCAFWFLTLLPLNDFVPHLVFTGVPHSLQ